MNAFITHGGRIHHLRIKPPFIAGTWTLCGRRVRQDFRTESPVSCKLCIKMYKAYNAQS